VDGDYMLTLERQKEILSYMKQKNAVNVSELSKRFFISEATIRRDLEKLDKQNLVKRTYGGAILLDGLSSDTPLLLRENENNSPKEQIAHSAAQFIKDGITVFMDSSSTVAKLIPHFENKSGITIVTNALKTAAKLSEYNDLTLYCTGGKIRNESVSMIGATARDFYSRYYADIVFFSCRGLSPQKGITDATDEESEIKQQMLKTAKTKILLCDSTKLNKVYFSLICPVNAVDYIILDNNANEDFMNTLKSTGANIICDASTR
jgi:DeoR/GlpR family transcriptional regulator of sugar metabolism